MTILGLFVGDKKIYSPGLGQVNSQQMYGTVDDASLW